MEISWDKDLTGLRSIRLIWCSGPIEKNVTYVGRAARISEYADALCVRRQVIWDRWRRSAARVCSVLRSVTRAANTSVWAARSVGGLESANERLRNDGANWSRRAVDD
jgi:hypothetical protein